MNLSERYQARVVSAEEAVRQIHSGNRIFLTANCSVPQKTLAALVNHAPQLENLEICQSLTIGPADYVSPEMQGHPLIGLKQAHLSRGGRLVKRQLDVGVALALLVLAAPLALLIALAVWLGSPGPAISRQTRIGENGRPFSIHKFRSMRASAEPEKASLLELNEASGPLFKIKDDPRVTGVGRLLRRTSLDELPNLINVLRGE